MNHSFKILFFLIYRSTALFGDQTVDLYSMSKDQLMNVDMADPIQAEITNLKSKLQSNQSVLSSLQKTNDSLCVLLKNLYSNCQSMHSITNDFGVNDLGCTANSSNQNVDSLTVSIQNDEGKTFVLLADDKYVSTPFDAQTKGAIVFKRTDNLVVKAPRYRDLTSLNIVTVAKSGNLGERAKRPDKLTVVIQLNGKNLLDDFTLYKPDDTVDSSSYRINPKGILDLRLRKECVVDVSTITKTIGG